MMFWIWLGLAAIAVILELATPTALVSIWFACGALCAWLLSVLHLPDWVQIAVFVIVSLLCMLVVRPIAVKYLRGNIEPTNADRVIGTVATVTRTIDSDRWGEVYAGHTYWSAVDRDHRLIEKGSRVRVLAIEGAKLVVTEVKGESL
ncbi:NfeD family protein [Faecalibaculum rodentium]|jgi:membrane protein implicated in regulation of membrane protease activity|uniref:NfeD family protein n=1 Tax=Faecalibaculum rodentium TaxID=1702221 RepID=UPI00256F44C4|nr:NfeD family protein [Faecalibaculum rodentium]